MTQSGVSPFFLKYIAAWVAFCLVAAYLLVRDRKRLAFELREYLNFLRVPWKLWFFAVAFIFVTIAGRYTNDETWDLVTGSGMSILTFLTAPWSVGIAYQALVGRRPLRYLVIAIALLLFSSSWFYDAYLLARDGAYTRRWAGNLMLSPIIYLAAGVFWNLEAKSDGNFHGDGFRLSFVRLDWPSRPVDTRFSPLVIPSIPLILVAAFVLVAFVGWRFKVLGQ